LKVIYYYCIRTIEKVEGIDLKIPCIFHKIRANSFTIPCIFHKIDGIIIRELKSGQIPSKFLVFSTKLMEQLVVN
jgi:hypothetical protein